jgi:hypothetical protein
MIKIINLSVFLYFIFSNIFAFAEIKFKDLKISTNNLKFTKLKSSLSGNIENLQFRNYFFSSISNDSLIGFLETFNINAKIYLSQANRWYKKNILLNDACKISIETIFFETKNNDSDYSCLRIRYINDKEISNPNFSKAEFFNLERRPLIIGNYIKKNKINISNKLIRSEHYLNASGNIYWVFLTYDLSTDNKLDKKAFIKLTFENHKKFESLLNTDTRSKLALRYEDLEITHDIVKVNDDTNSDLNKKMPKNSDDIVDKLKILREMLENGLISKEEFNLAKNQILN